MSAKPFGVSRPIDNTIERALLVLSTPKGPEDIILEGVDVGYFPNPGKPSHAILWHRRGVMIVDYHCLEFLGPDRPSQGSEHRR